MRSRRCVINPEIDQHRCVKLLFDLFGYLVLESRPVVALRAFRINHNHSVAERTDFQILAAICEPAWNDMAPGSLVVHDRVANARGIGPSS